MDLEEEVKISGSVKAEVESEEGSGSESGSSSSEAGEDQRRKSTPDLMAASPPSIISETKKSLF